MTYTADLDSFARDNLPPRSQWPEFPLDRPEFRYPARLNCATELLDKMVSRGFGHRPVIRAPDGGCNYTELYAQANRIANVLVRDMGLKPGNRVLLRGPNNPMMAACWFAVMKAGGVCVATMPLLRAKELTDIVNKARITHALCDARLAEELEPARPQCPTLARVALFQSDAPDGVPEEMISVMQVLAQASQGQAPPEFFSTHPSPDHRVQRIAETIQNPEVCPE